MTLFDVMHTGQPIGLQVRTRVPAYNRTPELPVTKKLAKFFGRGKANDGLPLSAAEELEQLRKELGAKRTTEPTPDVAADNFAESVVEKSVSTPIVEKAIASMITKVDASEDSFEGETPLIADEPPSAPPAAPKRTAPAPLSVRDRMAAAYSRMDDAADAPRLPSAPRRSFREFVSDRWAIASPKLQALTVHLRNVASRGAGHAGTHLNFVRELYSRYAVTAAAATGVVVLLCGSFYAGKLLFNRPAVQLASNPQSTDLAAPEVRSDVLDVPNNTRGTETLANVQDTETKAKLERTAEPALAKAGAFGGRRPDLNYVIVQSYFSQAEAQATVDVLSKYGAKTTVELNLPRWAMAGKNLYSVVSVDGFTKMTGNADFQNFMSTINKISDKEAGTALPKKLDPRPYRLQPQS